MRVLRKPIELQKYNRLSNLPRTLTLCRQCSCSSELSHLNIKSTKSNPPKPDVDHRTLGAKLDLFSTSPYSPGSPLFHADGAHIFHKLQSFLRAQYPTYGIREVITPTIYKRSLWEKSGHWENYKDDMFEVSGRGATGANLDEKEIGEDESYGLKPMNCPGHCLLFKSQTRSYRDLPIRYADFSPLHRNEVSGALSGLTRVRRFHQDDGHIFCTPEQVGIEIKTTLDFVRMVYETFGLGQYKLVLSTRPKDKFIGNIKEWDQAETQLKEALNESGGKWEVNDGDGAFYGPKIDIILKDSDGKEHQTATIQLDFQLPLRFDLHYQGRSASAENTPQRPVIIHRAILGSFERFMALLIEHYKGRWPFWLSPRQAIILTVGNDSDVLDFAESAKKRLSRPTDFGVSRRRIDAQTFLVDADLSDRSLSKKIVEARKLNYSILCVVGPQNLKDRSLNTEFTITWRPAQPSGVSTDERGLKSLGPGKFSEEKLVQRMTWLNDSYL
ncbi:hypothetical protein MMC20_005220 [Loxospora ochrophaea]|nr:hypothetical protein [Loxospora ochrophaea]